VENIKVSLNYDQNSGCFKRRLECIFDHISLNFSWNYKFFTQ